MAETAPVVVIDKIVGGLAGFTHVNMHATKVRDGMGERVTLQVLYRFLYNSPRSAELVATRESNDGPALRRLGEQILRCSYGRRCHALLSSGLASRSLVNSGRGRFMHRIRRAVGRTEELMTSEARLPASWLAPRLEDLMKIERILQTPAVLHVPYIFFPRHLWRYRSVCPWIGAMSASRGYLSAVAASGCQNQANSESMALTVYRFAFDRSRRIELAYGVPDEIAAEGFRAVLRKVHPRIVHLHARTSAISELLIDAAHNSGAAVVFTYHTPTVSCIRGTMMLFGQTALRWFHCVEALHGVRACRAWRSEVASRVGGS